MPICACPEAPTQSWGENTGAGKTTQNQAEKTRLGQQKTTSGKAGKVLEVQKPVWALASVGTVAVQVPVRVCTKGGETFQLPAHRHSTHQVCRAPLIFSDRGAQRQSLSLSVGRSSGCPQPCGCSAVVTTCQLLTSWRRSATTADRSMLFFS